MPDTRLREYRGKRELIIIIRHNRAHKDVWSQLIDERHLGSEHRQLSDHQGDGKAMTRRYVVARGNEKLPALHR